MPRIPEGYAKIQSMNSEAARVSAQKAIDSRYSLAYATRDIVLADSPEFRVRIAAKFQEILSSIGELRSGSTCESDLARLFETELGVRIPWSGGPYYSRLFSQYIEQLPIKKLLDLVTLVWAYLTRNQYGGWPKIWCDFVNRVIQEEQLVYEVDQSCCIKRKFDSEFAVNTSQAIAALEGAKHQKSAKAFRQALADLSQVEYRGRSAIRESFEALENLVKVVCLPASIARLDDNAVKGSLKAKMLVGSSGDQKAKPSTELLLEALIKWIAAAHNYRHSDSSTQPTEPSLNLSVMMVSHAGSYLRWIAETTSQASTAVGERESDDGEQSKVGR